jgi:hypothetical protein
MPRAYSADMRARVIARVESGADARDNRRIGDLVAVEMQNRQHCAVYGRVDELVGAKAEAIIESQRECPRAANGHAAAAPPRSVMNSRRLMFPLRLGRRFSQGRRL